MRRWQRHVALLLGLSLVGTMASAMSLREFHALEKSNKVHGGEFALYFLVGAMEGAVETNAANLRSGGKALFCIQGRRLEPRMARSLFDTELKRNASVYEADMPVQLVMLNALTTAYPC